MRLAEQSTNETFIRWVEGRLSEAGAGDEVAALVRYDGPKESRELRVYLVCTNGLVLVAEHGDTQSLRRLLWRDVGKVSLRCEVGADDVLWWVLDLPDIAVELRERGGLAAHFLAFATEVMDRRPGAP